MVENQYLYSAKEATMMIDKFLEKDSKYSLFEWILILLYTKRDIPIVGLTQFVYQFLSLYNLIFYREDLRLIFEISDDNVLFNEDVINTLALMISNGYIEYNNENLINITKKGENFIHSKFENVDKETIAEISKIRNICHDEGKLKNENRKLFLEYEKYRVINIKHNSRKAEELIKNKEYDSAIQTINKVLELKPTDITTLFNKGICYKSLGEKKEASIYFNKILDLDPSFTKAKEQILELKHLKRENQIEIPSYHPPATETRKVMWAMIKRSPDFAKIMRSKRLTSQVIRTLRQRGFTQKQITMISRNLLQKNSHIDTSKFVNPKVKGSKFKLKGIKKSSTNLGKRFQKYKEDKKMKAR